MDTQGRMIGSLGQAAIEFFAVREVGGERA